MKKPMFKGPRTSAPSRNTRPSSGSTVSGTYASKSAPKVAPRFSAQNTPKVVPTYTSKKTASFDQKFVAQNTAAAQPNTGFKAHFVKKPILDEESKNPYPMRINKYIALHQSLTRREADTLIDKKLVRINGVVAVLGDKVQEKDSVVVESKDVQKIKHTYMYFAYNKPKGVLTHSPTNKDTDIKTAMLKESSISPHVSKQLFPIGRLDKKSEGLIVLTNDGRLSDKLLNPDYIHEKEYVVTVAQKLPSFFQKSMEKGVNIGDYVTKPCTVEILGAKTFSITLTEGKKHQIRRMCEAMRTELVELKLIRIMNINLGAIKPNDARKIEGKPLNDFLKALKLS
jgi:23S rRNA pseudouridine2604 synthase